MKCERWTKNWSKPTEGHCTSCPAPAEGGRGFSGLGGRPAGGAVMIRELVAPRPPSTALRQRPAVAKVAMAFKVGATDQAGTQSD